MNNNLETSKQAEVEIVDGEQNIKVELERLKQQLISREKLAFIGQLSAGILHEIKNPLNFVNTFSKLSVELLAELEVIIKKYSASADKKFLDELLDMQSSLKINFTKVLENGQRVERIILAMLAQARENKGVESVLTGIS